MELAGNDDRRLQCVGDLIEHGAEPGGIIGWGWHSGPLTRITITYFGIFHNRIADCVGDEVGFQPQARAVPQDTRTSAARRRPDTGRACQEARPTTILCVEV